MATLLEKIDQDSRYLSLQKSVLSQIQRVISTRTYLGSNPSDNSYVTGFGLPEIVDQYAANEDQQWRYCQLIRTQILLLEPRISDVEIKAISSDESRGNCQLLIRLGKETMTETFYF